MGLFSGITEKIFGGTDNSAQKEQIKQNKASREFTEAQLAQSREDINSLYPRGDQARNDSYNAALALMGQSIPEQSRLFQQGNVGAQQQLLSGVPSYQSAIMGTPYQYNMQPMALQQSPASMFQVQLPQFGSLPEHTQQPQQPQQPQNPFNIREMLGGRFNV